MAALPLPAGVDAQSAEDGNIAIAEVLGRLRGPLSPEDIASMVDRAVSALKHEAVTRIELGAKPDALAQALLQALQTLIGGLPLRAESGDSEHPSKKVIDGLLRRLEQPLVPFDLVEITSDALAVFEQDTPTAAPDWDDGTQAANSVDLSGALLEALRMIIGGLPLARDPAEESGPQSSGVAAELLRRMAQPLDPFDILEVANQALSALEQNSEVTAERHRQQNEELQAMISMLAETVGGLSVQKSASVSRLQQIERRIEQASLVEDLRSLKASLADCLDAVREACANQQKQSAETIQLVERHLFKAKSRLPVRRKPDSDGIWLEAKPEAKPAEYIVVFLLDRETSIATRFGDDVRQSILRFLNQRLKDALLPSDRIVRWKGAAFLASLKRTGSAADIRAELSSVVNIQVPSFVEIGTRSIRLPVSLSWAIFPQSGFSSLDRLFEKVDEFIARTQGHVGG